MLSCYSSYYLQNLRLTIFNINIWTDKPERTVDLDQTADQGLHCLLFSPVLDASPSNQMELFRFWD